MSIISHVTFKATFTDNLEFERDADEKLETVIRHFLIGTGLPPSTRVEKLEVGGEESKLDNAIGSVSEEEEKPDNLIGFTKG